jgi:hypothetical protein
MKKRRPLPPERKRISQEPFAVCSGSCGPGNLHLIQVEPMIAEALKYDGPALAEVPVSCQELSMPPTITLDQAKGFSLFMLKAVLSGRGDEIVDLARVNLDR